MKNEEVDIQRIGKPISQNAWQQMIKRGIFIFLISNIFNKNTYFLVLQKKKILTLENKI